MPIPQNMKDKIALFCNVRKNVVENATCKDLYEVPLMLENEGLAKAVCRKLNLSKIEPHNEEWEKMVQRILNLEDKNVTIAIVGKYTKLEDSYLSVVES